MAQGTKSLFHSTTTDPFLNIEQDKKITETVKRLKCHLKRFLFTYNKNAEILEKQDLLIFK